MLQFQQFLAPDKHCRTRPRPTHVPFPTKTDLSPTDRSLIATPAIQTSLRVPFARNNFDDQVPRVLERRQRRCSRQVAAAADDAACRSYSSVCLLNFKNFQNFKILKLIFDNINKKIFFFRFYHLSLQLQLYPHHYNHYYLKFIIMIYFLKKLFFFVIASNIRISICWMFRKSC